MVTTGYGLTRNQNVVWGLSYVTEALSLDGRLYVNYTQTMWNHCEAVEFARLGLNALHCFSTGPMDFVTKIKSSQMLMRAEFGHGVMRASDKWDIPVDIDFLAYPRWDVLVLFRVQSNDYRYNRRGNATEMSQHAIRIAP